MGCESRRAKASRSLRDSFLRKGSFGAAVLAAAVILVWPADAGAQLPTPSPTPGPTLGNVFGGASGQNPPPSALIPTPPAGTAPVAPPAEAPAAPAAPASGSDIILGIRVVGYQTVSPDTIAHYLGIKVGDPYDPEKLRQNFPALWEAGLLENAKIEAERSPEGVTLVVTIEERPVIKDVDYVGNKKLSTSQI